MDGADDEDCDLDIDFICKPNYHSTPKLSSGNDHSRKLCLTTCDNISPLANPLIPDNGSHSKIKAQVKFKRCRPISELQPIGPKDTDNVENLPKSGGDLKSLAKPKVYRLRELNVSRFNEEFMILGEVGKGSQSYVYKCLLYMNGCIYAVKITSNPIKSDFHEKIVKNEIYAHSILSHENIVRNYSSWIEEDHAFIQNEYCDLGSLEEYEKTNLMSENLLRRLLLQMAQALKYIHNKGLAHMDIKPENIFLKSKDTGRSSLSDNDDSGVSEKTDDDIIFKLGDFGHVTKINHSIVSLDEESDLGEDDCQYLPREVLEGNLKYLDKSDIYSLGLTVLEVSSGGSLSKKEDKWQEIRSGNLKSLRNLSHEFSNILKAMIHPQPEKRPSASDLNNMVQLSNSLFQHAEDDYMHQYYHGCTRLEHKVETTGHYLRELFKSHGQYQDHLQTRTSSNECYSRKRIGSDIKTRIVGKKAKRSNSTMF